MRVKGLWILEIELKNGVGEAWVDKERGEVEEYVNCDWKEIVEVQRRMVYESKTSFYWFLDLNRFLYKMNISDDFLVILESI